MYKLINNLKIRNKLLLLLVTFLLAILITTSISLNVLKSNILADRADKVNSIVEASLTILEYYYEAAQQGRLSNEEAKESAKEMLSKVRYSGDEYLFITDMDARMVMHPIKPKLNGKDFSNFKDPAGNLLFVEMAKVVRKDSAGFVSYMWAKPGHDSPVEKLSYVIGFTPWDWILGTGLYLDDVDTIYWENVRDMSLIVLLIALITGFISIFIASLITKPIDAIKRVITTIATSKDLTLVSTINSQDEVGEISKALNEMLLQFSSSLGNVLDSANILASSSEEMSVVTQQTRSSVEQQNFDIEQVATAMRTECRIGRD